jgi:hypothetical protein
MSDTVFLAIAGTLIGTLHLWRALDDDNLAKRWEKRTDRAVLVIMTSAIVWSAF